MKNFCTLFDSHYLDKGLVLYNSLEKCTKAFTLYVFCFDEKAFEVLTALALEHIKLIKEEEIETPELIIAKENRTRAEFCWTCTPVIIEYILNNYKVQNCTYIDCDLFFYKDPQILFDELKSKDHVIITPHRLSESKQDRRTEARYGKYCVEFNYFDQSPESRKALTWWKERCLEWCYCKVEDGKYGDQKYLDSFEELFDGIHVLQNLGGGVAPWNIRQYELEKADEEEVTLTETRTSKEFDLVFYHFQSIRFLNDNQVNINSGCTDPNMIQHVYYPYMRRILEVRKELEKYDVHFRVAIVHSSSLLKRIYQRYIRPRMVHNLYDIIDLSEL